MQTHFSSPKTELYQSGNSGDQIAPLKNSVRTESKDEGGEKGFEATGARRLGNSAFQSRREQLPSEEDKPSSCSSRRHPVWNLCGSHGVVWHLLGIACCILASVHGSTRNSHGRIDKGQLQAVLDAALWNIRTALRHSHDTMHKRRVCLSKTTCKTSNVVPLNRTVQAFVNAAKCSG